MYNTNRTALFADASRRVNSYNNLQNSTAVPEQVETPSPYESSKIQRSSYANIERLESQNNEEIGVISEKVKLLKDLGLKMGNEIKSSTSSMDELNNTFALAGTKVKLTYNRMLIMSKNANISWKVWLGFFFAVFLFFFWVWIK